MSSIQRNLKKLLNIIVLNLVVLVGSGEIRQLKAFNQPPTNLSATTFLDGGAPQGFYYLNYTILTEGKEAVDNNGNKIPGDARVNVLAQLHQFYYLSKLDFLGGKLAFDVVVPVVAPSAKGFFGPFPVSANTAGMGDLLVGPAIHWDGRTMFGKPVFHRVEADVILPTGKYDENKSVNPGSNLVSVDSFYSFVMFLNQRWETSWRLWYAYHGKNKDDLRGILQPGQRFHVNYAASYSITPKLRIGGAGYYLQQLTDDEFGGIKVPDSKERVMAFGPGLVYMGQGLVAMVSHPFEFEVRNRFKGSRTTLQLIHKF